MAAVPLAFSEALNVSQNCFVWSETIGGGMPCTAATVIWGVVGIDRSDDRNQFPCVRFIRPELWRGVVLETLEDEYIRWRMLPVALVFDPFE